MPKFRKKPIVIEARQTGQSYDEDCSILKWCGGYIVGDDDLGGPNEYEYRMIGIDTLEGGFCVSQGDWVIKGIQGEFYSCKPDIFDATYDLVDDLAIGPCSSCGHKTFHYPNCWQFMAFSEDNVG